MLDDPSETPDSGGRPPNEAEMRYKTSNNSNNIESINKTTVGRIDGIIKLQADSVMGKYNGDAIDPEYYELNASTLQIYPNGNIAVTIKTISENSRLTNICMQGKLLKSHDEGVGSGEPQQSGITAKHGKLRQDIIEAYKQFATDKVLDKGEAGLAEALIRRGAVLAGVKNPCAER